MAERKKSIVLQTGVGRASFVWLAEVKRKLKPDDADKYGLALMLSDADIAPIWAAVNEIAEAEFGSPQMPAAQLFANKQLRNPIRHGNELAAKYPEFAGTWFIDLSSNRAPPCVASDAVTIIAPAAIYSGCFVRCQITIKAYATGSKGVNAYVNYVQFVRDGEPLGNMPSVAGAIAIFEPIQPLPGGYGAPQAPVGPSAGYGAPQAAPNGYGAPQAPVGPQAPAPAGYPPQPPNGYGAPQAPVGPQAPAPQPPNGYGAPQPPNGYGAPQPPNGYGAPPPPSGYAPSGYAPQQPQVAPVPQQPVWPPTAVAAWPGYSPGA